MMGETLEATAKHVIGRELEQPTTLRVQRVGKRSDERYVHLKLCSETEINACSVLIPRLLQWGTPTRALFPAALLCLTCA